MDRAEQHTRRFEPAPREDRQAARTATRVRAGTSGFSYKEWKGSFYPEDLPQARMLEFYAGRLPACEINNTFYRMPKAHVLEEWAERTPEAFRFVLKASRRITHQSRLKDVADPLDYLMRTAAALGARLGPFLFQLPPNLRKDTARLGAFLELIPPDRRIALEFRHPSWLEPDVFDLLGAHDAALCVSEDDENPIERVATAGWGYLRLRRSDYDETALEEWAEWVRAQPWDEAYVFFKHEEGATGPRLAERFMELAE